MPSGSSLTLVMAGSVVMGLTIGLLLTGAAQLQAVHHAIVQPNAHMVSSTLSSTTAALGTAPQVVTPTLDSVRLQDAARAPEDNGMVLQQMQEVEQFVGDMVRVAVPVAGVVTALAAGLLARVVVRGKQEGALQPMEMEASEAMPLARRGALAALFATPLAAAGPALAAKSGGRIGGGGGFRAFSQSRAVPPPPPAAGSGPTTVYIAPSPPMGISPFGMAPAAPFGFGISTGQLLALSAIELGDAFIREQRRQEYLRQQLEIQRQLGRDQAQIESLQQQLAMQDQRMRDLQAAMQQKGVPAPAQ